MEDQDKLTHSQGSDIVYKRPLKRRGPMLDIGMQELFIIFLVALLVLGPRKLPELARTLGKAVGELKRAMYGILHSIEEAESSLPAVDKIGDFVLAPQPPAVKNEDQKEQVNSSTPPSPSHAHNYSR